MGELWQKSILDDVDVRVHFEAKTMEVIDLCLSGDDAGASVPRVSKSTEGAIDLPRGRGSAAMLLCSK